MTQVDLVRGDKNYYLQFRLEDVVGTPFNLSGDGTPVVVKLKMQKYGSSSITFSKDGEIVNAEKGIVKFKIGNELLSEWGDYVAEIETTWLSTNQVLTVDGIHVHITKDLPRV